MTNEQLVLRIQNGENVADNMAALYEQNRGIITMLAKRYSKYAEFEDLMQEGYIGLSDAVDAWDPEFGVLFMSYATFWIRQAMSRYIENNGSCIRMPVRRRWLIWKYKRTRQQYLAMSGQEPEDDELCRLMEVSTDVLQQIKQDSVCACISSLDTPVGEDQETPLQGFIPDKTDAYEHILNEIQNDELKAVIWPMVDSLTGNRPSMIRMRFQDKRTLEDIGNTFGVTKESVRYTLEDAFLRLRRHKDTKLLKPFLSDDMLRSKSMQGTGVNTFKRTHTSSVERIILWMEERNGARGVDV